MIESVIKLLMVDQQSLMNQRATLSKLSGNFEQTIRQLWTNRRATYEKLARNPERSDEQFRKSLMAISEESEKTLIKLVRRF